MGSARRTIYLHRWNYFSSSRMDFCGPPHCFQLPKPLARLENDRHIRRVPRALELRRDRSHLPFFYCVDRR